MEDRRFMLRKSGYGGHRPMFPQNDLGRVVPVKVVRQLREVKVTDWSMSGVPQDRQAYPTKKAVRPEPMKRIVGFSGHRKGAAFITGENFIQEEILTTKGDGHEVHTYEADKSLQRPALRSSHLSLSTDSYASDYSGTPLRPRIPGGPFLLRSSRRPQSAAPAPSSPLKRQPWPRYPIMRGPTKVRIGGQDMFLTN
eukprot:TRINITY_DN11840_c1_g1_i1.p1 TRINITY_DN11840_c1_g1~~TRINITY_DN11840_c1_g1_i1.p1  ORF type:complete len:224 (+),score=38.36 TRINITY_DN11840_c1_g1_i1:85-672(+)